MASIERSEYCVDSTGLGNCWVVSKGSIIADANGFSGKFR